MNVTVFGDFTLCVLLDTTFRMNLLPALLWQNTKRQWDKDYTLQGSGLVTNQSREWSSGTCDLNWSGGCEGKVEIMKQERKDAEDEDGWTTDVKSSNNKSVLNWSRKKSVHLCVGKVKGKAVPL